MSISRQPLTDPDQATVPIAGSVEDWQPGELAPHQHARHQLILATHGVIHIFTASGEWVLPPSRAILITGGVEHSLLIKRPAKTRVLYIDPQIHTPAAGQACLVLDISPLVRELILACSLFAWHQATPAQERLSLVLIDQIQSLAQTPVNLPLPSDHRALRIVAMLRREPANRQSLDTLARRAGTSARTVERVFVRETHLPFGTWRQHLRLITALEHLAYGDSVTRVALDVGYESPSSFVVAFRTLFGTTPARYFKTR